MTANHDLERRIADFYATEPVLRAPDRVLGNALTAIESTPQRRVLMQAPWRFRPLNTYAKLAIAAVAIVAVAFTVRTLMPGNNIGGPPTHGPAGTPLSSPTPDATATQVAALELPADDRPLEPARYYVVVPGSDVRVEFAVLETDWRGNGWYLASPRGSLSFWTVANVYANACEESLLPDPPVGPSVDELVAALDAQENTDLQRLDNPSVGRYPSTRIIMELSARLGTACLGENLELWVGPGGQPGRSIDVQEPPGGREDVMWLVDAGGNRVVIGGYYDRTAPEEARSFTDLIDSIQFVLP